MSQTLPGPTRSARAVATARGASSATLRRHSPRLQAMATRATMTFRAIAVR